MPHIRREILDEGVCLLTFDRSDSTENRFDRATLEELEQHLEALAALDPPVRGLILASAQPDVFIGTADLHGVRQLGREELTAFIELGQRVFSKLARLDIPSAAAIHGAAVSGGCEVALACDWRVASPDACTRIGLPETKLGLVPAWGGCMRLPRLIGLPAALDLILAGKTVNSAQAFKLGLVDEVAARANLVRAALLQLLRGKHPSTLRHSTAANVVVDAVIAPRVRHDVERQTHGHYPAVRKAMDVVMQAASAWTERGSRSLERNAIHELIGTDITKHLLNQFLLEERASSHASPDGADPGPQPGKVAIIGAGAMGACLTHWITSRGRRVILGDLHPVRIAVGMESVRARYAEAVERHSITALEARAGLDRVSPAAGEVPLPQVDLVIEAAVEKLAVKQDIFRRLESRMRADALLATTTSALSITTLAAATQHPQRVVGLHFFHPVHQMPLVEVVAGRETAPEAMQRAVRFVQEIGKLPVRVKDSPGFLVHRILSPYLGEAALLLGEGAKAAEIDGAMLDFGMPAGPLALADAIGIDVVEELAVALRTAFPDRCSVPEIFTRMVISGSLGRKSGKGFHEYAGGENRPDAEREKKESPRDRLERRMVLAMVNEAARCLDEGVVETPADVDFAMVSATGWAPFRGGPLRYADALGLDRICAELSRLATEVHARFTPCSRLTELAGKKGRFYED